MMFMYTALCLRKNARCPSNFPPLHADAASNSALNLYIYKMHTHTHTETTEPLQLETGHWQLIDIDMLGAVKAQRASTRAKRCPAVGQ